jgi:hypothetical protein
MANEQATKRILLATLHNGCFAIISLPPGVQVELRDYDIAGVPEADLETDEDGQQFLKSEWGPT